MPSHIMQLLQHHEILLAPLDFGLSKVGDGYLCPILVSKLGLSGVSSFWEKPALRWRPKAVCLALGAKACQPRGP